MGNRAKMGRSMGVRDGIDENNVTVCHACCCFINGFMCTECCGCAIEEDCFCLRYQCCCKSGADQICCTPEEDECCQLGCGCCGYSCKKECCNPCCKAEAQQCCFVGLCAFPPGGDSGVPFTIAWMGLMCVPQFGCCKKLGELGGGGGGGGGDSAVQGS